LREAAPFLPPFLPAPPEDAPPFLAVDFLAADFLPPPFLPPPFLEPPEDPDFLVDFFEDFLADDDPLREPPDFLPDFFVAMSLSLIVESTWKNNHTLSKRDSLCHQKILSALLLPMN
jgi:hypothetical protein